MFSHPRQLVQTSALLYVTNYPIADRTNNGIVNGDDVTVEIVALRGLDATKVLALTPNSQR